MKDQREREDRERLEEVESYKKENKDLKEKVNSLQIELTEKEVSEQRDFLEGCIHMTVSRTNLYFSALQSMHHTSFYVERKLKLSDGTDAKALFVT